MIYMLYIYVYNHKNFIMNTSQSYELAHFFILKQKWLKSFINTRGSCASNQLLRISWIEKKLGGKNNRINYHLWSGFLFLYSAHLVATIAFMNMVAMFGHMVKYLLGCNGAHFAM